MSLNQLITPTGGGVDISVNSLKIDGVLIEPPPAAGTAFASVSTERYTMEGIVINVAGVPTGTPTAIGAVMPFVDRAFDPSLFSVFGADAGFTVISPDHDLMVEIAIAFSFTRSSADGKTLTGFLIDAGLGSAEFLDRKSVV